MKRFIVLLAMFCCMQSFAQKKLTIFCEVNTVCRDTTFVVVYSGTHIAFKGERSHDYDVKRSVRPDSTHRYIIDKYYNKEMFMEVWIDVYSSEIQFMNLSYYPFTTKRQFLCK